MTRTSVLFVDDEDHIRKAVATYLDRRGYDVTLARDGEDAMRAIGANPPDVLVTDVMMPRMDGIELTRRLRAHARTAALPILMLSARKQEESFLAGYSAGADDYIAKPVQLSVLTAKIDALLRRRELPAAGPREPAWVVTFLHAKGGVGTTTLLVNAAASVSKSPERSYIIDASLPFGDAAMQLDLDATHSLADIAECDPQSIDETILGQIATQHASGLRVVAAPNSPIDADRITGAIVRATIAAAVADSDIVWIDTACAFNEATVAAIDCADVVCVVTAPHVSSLRATQQLLGVLKRMDVAADRIHIAVSRTAPGGVEDNDIRAILEVASIATIPYSEPLWTSQDEGRPIVLTRPETSAAVALCLLGEKLRRPEKGPRRANVGDRVDKLIPDAVV
jgi:pilus assembly protein CpaE